MEKPVLWGQPSFNSGGQLRSYRKKILRFLSSLRRKLRGFWKRVKTVSKTTWIESILTGHLFWVLLHMLLIGLSLEIWRLYGIFEFENAKIDDYAVETLRRTSAHYYEEQHKIITLRTERQLWKSLQMKIKWLHEGGHEKSENTIFVVISLLHGYSYETSYSLPLSGKIF